MGSKVVISILNWNGREMTRKCLESVLSYTNHNSFEIVVVDNGSTDGSVEMVQDHFPDVKLIENPVNEGFSRANNRVLKYSLEIDADFTLLLNNDIEVYQEDWLKTLVDMFEYHDDLGIVGCKVIEPDGKIGYDGRYFPINWMPTFHDYKYNKHQNGKHNCCEFVDDIIGAVFLINNDVIRDVGFLNEKYSPAYWEETDYCVRAWDAGYKQMFTSDVEVRHNPNQTSNKLDQDYLRYIKTRNALRFFLTSYPVSWVILSIPYLLACLTMFFFYRDCEGDIKLKRPLRPVTKINYIFSIFADISSEAKWILGERNNRTNVKKLLK